jgi:hypothetical protein
MKFSSGLDNFYALGFATTTSGFSWSRRHSQESALTGANTSPAS